MRRVEAAAVCVLLVAGVALRIVHLGTPSLWWDEFVQIRTAEVGGIADVVREVREGVAPGSGNAGAVPLDYLALHAWLAAVPRPAPEHLEPYYRFPSFVWSCLTLGALWWTTRRLAGPTAALVATALLATSVFHALYAAEARFYSLFALATVANLAAFGAVVATPERPRAWIVYAAVNALYVLSALYGIFLIGCEHVVLGVLVVLRAWRTGRRAPVAAFTAAAAALACVVIAYLWEAAFAFRYPRGPDTSGGLWSPILDTMVMFAAGDRVLAWLYLAAFPLALWDAWTRSRDRLPLATTLVLSLGSIPMIVLVARWKHYYYHPRHAIFLLPVAQIAAALAADALLRPLVARRRALATTLAIVVPLVLAAPTVWAYVGSPLGFFAKTKTGRDFAGLARDLAARVAALEPRERWVLLAEKNRSGHLANPVLAFYLDAYGLADRVVLRGFTDPPRALARLGEVCRAYPCRAFRTPSLDRVLEGNDPFDQPLVVRRLLQLRALPSLGGFFGGASAVVWAPHAPLVVPPGFVRRIYAGFDAYEPATD